MTIKFGGDSSEDEQNREDQSEIKENDPTTSSSSSGSGSGQLDPSSTPAAPERFNSSEISNHSQTNTKKFNSISNDNDQYEVIDIETEDFKGQGATATVRKVQYQLVEKNSIEEKEQESKFGVVKEYVSLYDHTLSFEREKQILQHLKVKNVISLIGYQPKALLLDPWYEMTIKEYGEQKYDVNKDKDFKIQKHFYSTMLSTLKDVHSYGVYHSDICDENTLISPTEIPSRLHILLIDFGHSECNQDDNTKEFEWPSTCLQKLTGCHIDWTSPPEDDNSSKRDLYMMVLTGLISFHKDLLIQEMNQQIKSRKVDWKMLLRGAEEREINFYKEGLNVDEKQRPTAEMLLAHQWINDGEVHEYEMKNNVKDNHKKENIENTNNKNK